MARAPSCHTQSDQRTSRWLWQPSSRTLRCELYSRIGALRMQLVVSASPDRASRLALQTRSFRGSRLDESTDAEVAKVFQGRIFSRVGAVRGTLFLLFAL